MFQGDFAEVQPVNNDHDPDNDQLAICRLGTEHYRGMQAIFIENDWAVFAKRKAKPGTYTFTYYACDFSYLTPGTITVTVEALPKITVQKIASKPGHLRVTNPADVKIRFLYGSFEEDRPDGNLIIDKDSSVVISVHRTRIDWIATDRKGELFFVTRSRQRHQAGARAASAAGGPGRPPVAAGPAVARPPSPPGRDGRAPARHSHGVRRDGVATGDDPGQRHDARG